MLCTRDRVRGLRARLCGAGSGLTAPSALLGWRRAHLQHALVGGLLLQLDQPVQDDQLHVVVALLYDQVDVALSGGLQNTNGAVREAPQNLARTGSHTALQERNLKKNVGLAWDELEA